MAQFQPGQSGNPGYKVIHGFYRRRTRRCDACNTEYTARSLSSRYCSDQCRVQRGAWSFKANEGTLGRVLGETRG